MDPVERPLPQAISHSLQQVQQTAMARLKAIAHLQEKLHASVALTLDNYQHQLAQLHIQLQAVEREQGLQRAKQQQQQQQLAQELPAIHRDLHQLQQLLSQLDRLQTNIAQMQLQIADLDRQQAEAEARLVERLKRTREAVTRDINNLETYSRLLGLRIEARKPNIIRFSFTNIDPRHPERVYQIDIDISGEDFVVVALAPDLGSNLLLLVEHELNDHRSVGKFLKTVRNLFKETLET